MAVYLILVAMLTLAAFLVAYRIAGWSRTARGVSVDVATGVFMLAFIAGLIMVGTFVGVGANLTDGSRVGAGLFVEAMLATMLFPVGILLLKKNADFS